MDDLSTAAAEHREALRDYLWTADAVDDADWNRSPGGDSWSPAQITEHLRLTYVTVRAELAGQGGFRVRSAWWQQRLFRWIYLPRILRHGRFPRGVPAVREIRPAAGPFDRASLLAALESEGEQFLGEVVGREGQPTRLRHPFLGHLSLVDAVRVTGQHIRHHRTQLPGD